MGHLDILHLCSRPQGHQQQYELLRNICLSGTDWNSLLETAEQHGMSPLVSKHCLASGCTIPRPIQMSLDLLYKRHQNNAEFRGMVLKELLQQFKQNGFKPLLIKGVALCQMIYDTPALRPMRDMDLLFHIDEIEKAQEMLLANGFTQSSAAQSPDHYHLPPLHKTIKGLSICLELHSGLYPDCPPGYPQVIFDELYAQGRDITVVGKQARTFGHEDMLHYVYQHGVRSPLPYESFKLINIADIIGYTEKYFHEINWQVIEKKFPEFYRALPLMDQITPWDLAKVSGRFKANKKRLHILPRHFNGWPRRRMKELEQRVPVRTILKNTFLPPTWWLKVYYGVGTSRCRYLWALLFEHPKHVFWWVHLYSHFVIQTKPHEVNPDNTFWGTVRLFCISNWNKTKGVLVKLKKAW